MRPHDPLFPATAISTHGGIGLVTSGFDRHACATTEPDRTIVNTAFKDAGLEVFRPGSFRHMLAHHATRNCKTAAQVAEPQNLNQTDGQKTLRSYGHMGRDDQPKLITEQDNDVGLIE